MTIKQSYTRRQNAKRAAIADLGKEAVEGTDYTITKLPDSRYAYAAVKPATRPDKAATRRSGTETV